MKYLGFLVVLCAISIGLTSFVSPLADGEERQFKCMIQLTNYTGEGAYIVVSVLDSEDNYVKTLRVLGDDEEWYPDIPTWWEFHESKNKPNIDGITGATIAGGERSIFVLDIDESYLNNGYQLRFETSVEHQDYHKDDLKISINDASLKGKFEGTGYIRYVRILPQT
ncbi:DUF2271 domain-containing protein [Membranihabitans maritimus]|uniref:DUF2271 domain-containing protein n=1 Tax=Membranihabitans maritimus TaxID=2904244 RepID=UPI001F3B744E|nr:DUF2271 domain-containing protein [Membranihabitans maritimus]